MDIEVYINNHIKNEKPDKILIDDLNTDRGDKSFDQSKDDLKLSNFLSSRLIFMDEEFNEQDDKRSLLLLSRQYPTYRHFSRKAEKSNNFRFMNKYHILPEIRGQNLFGNERERSEETIAKNNLNVSSFKLDTLQQLQSSILRYGSSGENVWMGFTGQKYEHKLVRPGFSARRYLANLARNLNESLVKKLMCEGYILEKNLFTSNPVMPHIRRRLSYDLSRYPEPYRILKQMLIAPGPLNEFSFVWGRTSMLCDDGILPESHEMESGDIKILFKKNAEDGIDEFEEVQYAELSSPRKKTILSNLLVKSAMNHAIRIKEQMMEYSDHVKGTRNHVPNIHIPVVKFDMKKAINELLTKETLQTLSTTQMEIPFIEESVHEKFKGKSLHASTKYRTCHAPESVTVPEESQLQQQWSVFDDHNVTKEDKASDSYLPQHLTLRLNQSHPSKIRRKKKVVTSESSNGRESETSESVPHVTINPSDTGLKSTFAIDRESQGNAFAEMIKKRAELATNRKENIQPYGRYKNPKLFSIGDIDPTVSFSNWKYKEDHIHSLGTDSGYLTKTETTTVTNDTLVQSKHDHNRLVHLLRGQAEEVAEEVLRRSDGGMDFASDVNVAIRNIVGQIHAAGNQVWNLEVDDLENQADYQGVIKNIFKSIFKDELHNLGSDDLEVSPSLMKLLQSGFNLKLEDIEMVTDPTTGKMIAVLKKGVHIPNEFPSDEQIGSVHRSNDHYDDNNVINHASGGSPLDGSVLDSRYSVASSIYPFSATPLMGDDTSGIKKLIQSQTKGKTPVLNSNLNKEYIDGEMASSKIKENRDLNGDINENRRDISKYDIDNIVGDSTYAATVRSVSGKEILLQEFVQQNNLVEKDGKYFDNAGGYFTKEGQYFDTEGNIISSKSMKIELVAVTSVPGYIPGTSNTGNALVTGVDYLDRNAMVGEGNISTQYISNGATGKTNIKALNSTSQNSSTTANINSGLPLSYTIAGSIEKDKYGSSKENNQSSSRNKEGTASKSTTLPRKDSNKVRKVSTKDKKGKKKEFTFSRPDETKDIMKLYNRPEPSAVDGVKSKKSSDNKSKKKTSEDKGNEEQEQEPDEEKYRKEDSGDIRFVDNSKESSRVSDPGAGKDSLTMMHVDDDVVSDDEGGPGDNNEARRMKMLKRQERLAQRKAEVQRLRKEEEMKKKRDEEEKRIEAQRLSLEEALKMKLDEERRRKEEEFRLQKEREKEEEQALLDAERRKELYRLRQIEKERQQKEEYARRREEARIKLALEEKLRREEQELREREEAAMLAKLNEDERKEYLRKKAELLEQQRLEEEKERLIKEEQARLALEEAKLLAQKQGAEKRLQEERLRMRIEDEGLKKYLNVTPAFVWSYFEFLNMLGVNDDPSILRLNANTRS